MAINETEPRKHKRRTIPHKKHTAYPGITINPKEVKIESNSIRILEVRAKPNIPVPKPSTSLASEPLLEAFYVASKALAEQNTKSSNIPENFRNAFEWKYGFTYRKAMNKGIVSKLKDKYLNKF